MKSNYFFEWVATLSLLFLTLSPLSFLMVVNGQFGWQTRDTFDEIKFRYDSVNADNCQILQKSELFLPEDTVTHKPNIKDYDVNPVLPNRTALLHLHNMAMSRGIFWSYILQARFIRPAINDTYDPGMMYYFLSTLADVAANPRLNASSIYFSPNSSYSSSYRGFFNKTFPLFAPRTYRADDYNDPIHLQRISTLNTFMTQDLGSIPDGSQGLNYTTDYYRINDWYRLWLPDSVENRHDTKTTYQVEIRYANNTNETFTFHGPQGAEEEIGPVKWTRPYFDCGRSNKWIIGAVVPIVDIYPRHTGFRHVEYPTYTAVSVMEMDFERIDINQCPTGEGNPEPNRFGGTAQCKEETTECEPLYGYGFRRGGYQCRCRPGYRLPYVVRRPYLGEIIERSSEQMYRNYFNCDKIGWIQKQPTQWEEGPDYIREKYLDMYYNYRNFTWYPTAQTNANLSEIYEQRNLNIHGTLRFMRAIDKDSCKWFTQGQLTLQGDVAYGAREQYENEALMAVRLANFISAYLQIVDVNEVFTGKRVPDKELSEDQMMGETLAIILSKSRIWSSGVYWDRNKFTNRTLFAPFAYKNQEYTRAELKMEDLARLNGTNEVYTNQPWFKALKNRWITNYEELEKYYLKLHLRNNETGGFHRKFEQYPTFYRGANLKQGQWSTPFFNCHSKVPIWGITYSSPFFGWDSLRSSLEFKGIVSVTMKLDKLDINQCKDDYFVPNAFKDSDKCDKGTSYCVPIQGRWFETGGYKCECLQGYEYPFEDQTTYYDGQLVEDEFLSLINGNKTRYDMLKCRLAKGTKVLSNFILIGLVVTIVNLIF